MEIAKRALDGGVVQPHVATYTHTTACSLPPVGKVKVRELVG